MKVFFSPAVALAGAIAVVAACVAPAIAADPVTLDVLLPLTGPGTFIGKAEQDTLAALETVVNNQGGIHGRPVHFAIHDDGTSPQTAVQLFNQIAANHPNVLLGPGLASTCLAVAPLVASGPVDYCYSPAIHPKAGSFVFSSSVSTADFAVAFYRYFVAQKWTKIGMIASTDASGQDADTAFAAALDLPANKAAGLTIVGHEHFNPTDLSVDAQMQRLKASGAQVIVCYAPGTPFGTLLRGAHEAGITVPIATGNANMTYAQMKQYATFLPATLLFPGLPFLAHLAPTPAAKAAQVEFYDAFKAAGIRPDISHSTAWDPTLIVVDALRAVGADAPAEKVRAYIAGLHGYTGIAGTYDFRDGSQRGVTEKNIVVMRWDVAKDTWVAVSGPGGDAM